MSTRIASYLRTYRRRSGLSQEDLAFLLGLKSGQIISRYERLDRVPSLETVLACQLLFDALPHELYPGLYAKVESITRRRTKTLIARIAEHPDQERLARKHAFLLRIVERGGARRPPL